VDNFGRRRGRLVEEKLQGQAKALSVTHDKSTATALILTDSDDTSRIRAERRLLDMKVLIEKSEECLAASRKALGTNCTTAAGSTE